MNIFIEIFSKTTCVSCIRKIILKISLNQMGSEVEQLITFSFFF